MSELEFTKKPRRMTDPPQDECKWLSEFGGVEVKLETDPARIAYFAREATWGDIMREPTEEELADTLAEVAEGKTLGASTRGGYGFRIRASRCCMDQMLRLAESRGGAGSGAGAQTTRDNDLRNFNIVVPRTITELRTHEEVHVATDLYERVRDHVKNTRALYGELIDAGVPPQDARYVALPMGFQTQWIQVMSLGALTTLCEQRLCNGLTQHETNYLVRMMRDAVVGEQPWTDRMLRSQCEKRCQCVSRSMLFPPCGAFPGTHTDDTPTQYARTLYDPDTHLYPPEQNSAMWLAEWDRERVGIEVRYHDPMPLTPPEGWTP